MKYDNLLKLANKFYKLAQSHVWSKGKDYILQKEDGTLIVDNVQLDRNTLNAMKSWQELVDMGVSKTIVGEIAREYGGHPKDVDTWMERNSRPFVEEDETEVEKENIFNIDSIDFESMINESFQKAITDAEDRRGTMYGDDKNILNVGPRSYYIHTSYIFNTISHEKTFKTTVYYYEDSLTNGIQLGMVKSDKLQPKRFAKLIKNTIKNNELDIQDWKARNPNPFPPAQI